MKFNWIVLLTEVVLSVSVCATIEDEPDDDKERNCNFHFTPHKISTYYGTKTTCAYLFVKGLSWKEAKARCTIAFSQLTERIYFDSTLYTELLNKSIDLLWIGIRRRAKFFITGYPSKLFREADYFSHENWGYHWSYDEPGFGDCVAVNITTGFLHTRDCKALLPFVCDDNGQFTSNLPEGLICPEGWIISFSLSTSSIRTCIHHYEVHSYFEAEPICDKFGGHIASSEEYDILWNNEQYTENYYLKSGEFWIRKEKQDGACNIKVMHFASGENDKIVAKDCSYNYSFICVKSYKTKLSGINVHLSPSTMHPTVSSSLEMTDLVTCDLEADSEKGGFHEEVLYQWYKDDIPIPSNSYVIRISFVGEALKRDPYITDVATRQGNYHCEISFTGSVKTFSSQKLKFVYSDIATFIIDIQNIKYTKSLDFSSQDFTEHMQDFDEQIMSSVFEKLKLEYSRVEWDFNSISVQDGIATMKLFIYIYRTDGDDFDDLLACEEIREIFEEQKSVPVYLENVVFRVNCEDFSSTSGYYKTMKQLKAIKGKLNSMEETQSKILEKLENLAIIRHVNRYPNDGRFDLDFTPISKFAEELKQLERKLFGSSIEFPYLEESSDDRERNIFEDILPQFRNRKYSITSEQSKKIGFISSKMESPLSSYNGIISEEKKKYSYFPNEDERDLENLAPEKIYLEKEP